MATKSPFRSKQPVILVKEKKNSLTVAAEVRIDYPQEGERILPGHYAIRLSGPEQAQVEVRIDNGNWEPCRQSAGYFWYDWYPHISERVTLAYRYRFGKGRWKIGPERICTAVG